MKRCTSPTRLALLLLPALAVASCHAGDDVDDVDFRQVDLGGDGDISIFEHPAASEDDPIWQFHSGNVYSGSVEGPLVIKFTDDQILDENDAVLCTREGDALAEGERIREGDDGPVLYTVVGRQVYAGVPSAGDKPLYRFQGRHVVEGHQGPPLVSSDTHIQFASSMSKLVIVSLIDGECGAPGL